MAHIYVKNEKVLNANPADVYTVLSDYKNKRPQILPSNFIDYKVEHGGHGDGTVVSYKLHAARRERPYQMKVKEPVKGQVLTENDTNSSLVTTWTLLPLDDGQRTMVRVATEWEGGSGVGGFFERTFAPLGVHNIYNSLLNRLPDAVQTTGTDVSASPDFLNNQENPAKNFALFMLIFGSVIGLGFGISALRKRNATK